MGKNYHNNNSKASHVNTKHVNHVYTLKHNQQGFQNLEKPISHVSQKHQFTQGKQKTRSPMTQKKIANINNKQ